MFRKDFKMKKKFLSVLSLFVFMFSLTGCVKFNANMDIKKNKSMDFSIIYAFDTSIFGDESIISDSDKAEIEKQGFTVNDYSDGSMKGVTLTRNIKNIDSVSTSSDTEYDLSDIMNNSENGYIFKVNKGFFKNTYVAKFNFDASDSDLNSMTDFDNDVDENDIIIEDQVDVTDENDVVLDEETDVTDENDVIFDEENDISDDWSLIDDDSDFDLSNLEGSIANMDLSFNVTLPYSAISSNATSLNNGNKQLSWTLSGDSVETIEFTFSLYNITNILIVVGGALLLIIIILIVLLSSKKKKGNNVGNVSSDTISSVPELGSVNTNVQPFSEQSFNQQLMSQTAPINDAGSYNNVVQENNVSSDVSISQTGINPQFVSDVQPQVSNNGVVMNSNVQVNAQPNVFEQQNLVDSNSQQSVQGVANNVDPGLFEQSIPQDNIINQPNINQQMQSNISSQVVQPDVNFSNVSQPVVDSQQNVSFEQVNNVSNNTFNQPINNQNTSDNIEDPFNNENV